MSPTTIIPVVMNEYVLPYSYHLYINWPFLAYFSECYISENTLSRILKLCTCIVEGTLYVNNKKNCVAHIKIFLVKELTSLHNKEFIEFRL